MPVGIILTTFIDVGLPILTVSGTIPWAGDPELRDWGELPDMAVCVLTVTTMPKLLTCWVPNYDGLRKWLLGFSILSAKWSPGSEGGWRSARAGGGLGNLFKDQFQRPPCHFLHTSSYDHKELRTC